MNYIGLDHHRKFTQAVVIDEEDRVVLEARFPNTEEAVREFLKRVSSPCRAVVEAGPAWGWIVDTFQHLKVDILLANPHRVRLIAETRCKTDRRDARTLAQLLRSGWIPAIPVADAQTRLNKQLWRERIWLVRLQTRLKNRIRAHLAHHHVTLPEFSDLFGVAGRQFLQALRLPDKAQVILTAELALLESYRQHIQNMQRTARQATEDIPAVRYLKSLPGLGEVLGEIRDGLKIIRY